LKKEMMIIDLLVKVIVTLVLRFLFTCVFKLGIEVIIGLSGKLDLF
jgi:hypothetical protein